MPLSFPKRECRDVDPQRAAFENLALPLLPALYNVALWLSRNPIDAEDLVQETVLKALRGFSSFEPNTNFKAWISRIMRNAFLTSRAGLAALQTVALDDELGGSDDSELNSFPEAAIDRQSPEINVIRLENHVALQDAMARLSPHLLEVILLADVEELKYKEIAAILEIPVGTVMSRISRARGALRHTLETQPSGFRERQT